MKKIFLGLLLSLSVTLSYSQTTDAPQLVTSIEGIKEYSLKNGLQILLIPDPSQSNMVVNMVFHVGSKDEGYGEKGMAHLLEHMMFKSTKNMGDIKKQLSDKGGMANGTTWYDRTNYFEIFPSNDENLEWSLKMEADRMLNATILQSDLDKEFSVVRNEFEIGENDPAGVLQEKVFSAAFMWHNYGNSTIGSKEDIERVKVPSLRKFYEKYYQPDNATLIIAGKFDENNALKYISQYFGGLPRPTRMLDAAYTVEPSQDGERVVEVRRNGENKIIAAAYHNAAFADKDYAALDALSEVLTSNPSGYLYKSLVEPHIVSSLYSYSNTLKDPGLIYFSFDVAKDKNLDETLKIVKTELDKISTIAYTEEDLKRAKSKLLKQIENIKNNTVNYAISLTEIIGAGSYKLAFLYRDNVENLTLADLKRVAEKYFRENNRTIGIFRPSSNEVRVTPTEYQAEQIANLVKDYKGKAPEKEPAPFETSIANIKNHLQEGILSNGMKYGHISKELKGDKIIGTFCLKVGNEKDLSGKSAIQELTTSLMKAGTKTRTKEQIQDQLDVMKSNLYFYGGGQDLYIQFSTYKQYFTQLMEILRDILANSTFPENELQKTIIEYNTYLEGQLKDPQAIAQVELSRQTSPYPKTSIYYTPTLQEQIDNIKKVTREQVAEFYKQILGASSGAGTIIGNLDDKTIAEQLESTFAKFNAVSKYVLVPPTFFDTRKSVQNILTPDKENAVALGSVSLRMKQDNPDYPALTMANEILGSGGFLTARLPMRLREKEGISYGVGSYLNIPITNDVASWNYYAFLNPTKRNAVENAVNEEITKALSGGFTQEELDFNKKSYLNVRTTSLGMDNTLIQLENNKLLYGLPLEWFDELNTKMQNLKLDEVNTALQKYIQADRITSVFAGDFNKK